MSIAEAAQELRSEYGLAASVDERTILIEAPVKGSPHLAVLQAVGLAADDNPVGAAAHGPAGVAAGVWDKPDLYVVRWTGSSRWVAAYRFSSRGRPDDYLRDEGGIPSSLNRGSWYQDIPPEIEEAFLSVGMLIEEPPFPVPQPPRPKAAEPRPGTTRPRAAASPGPQPGSRRAAKPSKTYKATKPASTVRTCVACNLQKHTSQFEAGSDLCVDCR